MHSDLPDPRAYVGQFILRIERVGPDRGLDSLYTEVCYEKRYRRYYAAGPWIKLKYYDDDPIVPVTRDVVRWVYAHPSVMYPPIYEEITWERVTRSKTNADR